MRNVQDAVKHLKSMGVYEDYNFAAYDGGVIIATTDTNYKDLSAWKNLEFDVMSFLRSNSGVSSVINHSAYEDGIQNWNKDRCFLKFQVNFLAIH